MTDGSDYLVRRLRLRHLELLVALADKGTLRGAASQLNLSQPALSKMLGEVEAGFEARLFERSPQGVQLNALGATAVHRARVILHELARAAEDIAHQQAGASTVLRVGAPSVTATVPAAVRRLRERMPTAMVQIREGRIRELIQRLLEGELDCVFGAVTPELLASDLLPLLQSEVLVEDEVCVLASEAAPASAIPVRSATRSRRSTSSSASATPQRWADLQHAAWVLPPKETLVRQAFMTAFLDAGLQPPEPVIEVMSSVTIGSALRMDASLLCAVRLDNAREELLRGGVRRVPVSPAVPLPSLGLFTRRTGEPHPEVLRAFAQAMREAAGGFGMEG